MSIAATSLPSFVTRQDCDRTVVELGVHVWKAWLGDESEAGSIASLLSPDEADRAARFVFARHRQRFVMARAALRSVLGACLDESPQVLTFAYGPHGKPELGSRWHASDVQFNLAHSGEWALLAVACGKRVGIDVEQIRPNVSGPEIARRHFSPREVAVLESLPAELREEAFFRCWTRKEAYLKALGCGLSLGLDTFDVSLTPELAPALLAVRGDPAAPAQWRMAEVCPADGYLGAIVVEIV